VHVTISDGARRGLTLVEVMVALLVTSVVALIGRGVVLQLSATSGSAVRAVDVQLLTRSRDEDLHRMFRFASAPRDSTTSFEGSASEVVLTTRCRVPRGWDESCRCSLQVVALADGIGLKKSCAHSAVADTVVTDSVGLALRYLATVQNGGGWLREWGRSVSVPYAVGVIRIGAADTIIVRVGGRG
jgi:prepilin-type N-terminal cleavage/methylation domain-containing protein